MANEVKIRLQNQPPIKLDFNDKLILKYVEPNHASLSNLDYEHSGHIGFMPSKLSILPNTPKETPNGSLVLSVYNSDTEETSSIGFNDLVDRVIKTSSSVPTDLQKGQYLFLQINEED